MIDMTTVHILLPVLMTMTVTQGHRFERKLIPAQSCCRVAIIAPIFAVVEYEREMTAKKSRRCLGVANMDCLSTCSSFLFSFVFFLLLLLLTPVFFFFLLFK